MKNVFKKAALAAALTGAAFAANAAPIIGLFNFTVGSVIVSFGNVDWNNVTSNINPPPNLANRTYGDFEITSGATGSFAVIPVGSLVGKLQDLSNNQADKNYVPLGSSLPTGVPGFLQFFSQPNWLFTETFLSSGTLSGTPYILTEINTGFGTNVSATIAASGVACDTGLDAICDLTDSKTNWTGIFSAQYTNTTISALTTTILNGQSLANNAWSGTFEARAIPEPGSIALLGLGLVGLAAVRRRKSV